MLTNSCFLLAPVKVDSAPVTPWVLDTLNPKLRRRRLFLVTNVRTQLALASGPTFVKADKKDQIPPPRRPPVDNPKKNTAPTCPPWERTHPRLLPPMKKQTRTTKEPAEKTVIPAVEPNKDVNV